SSAPKPTHSTSLPLLDSFSRAMPALPGAHQSWVAWGDWASFHTKACSRPPEPITSILIRGIQPWPGQRLKETFGRRGQFGAFFDVVREKSAHRPRPGFRHHWPHTTFAQILLDFP